MRLLDSKTHKLVEFLQPPPYAILSHTWGAEEVTLQELSRSEARHKHGWRKISAFCRTAAAELGPVVEHGWVDTCCIDKTSSAELSESINSMFRWYQEAACCYAVLEDVENTADVAFLEERIAKSRWFTRGWTLQELLAPTEVKFFDRNWAFLGTRRTLADIISKATKIPRKVLLDGSLDGYSIAQKMSWASARQTTRLEDTAYSLLGIFAVNMPLLYGEGPKAFIRLQEEILRESEDQSILAWDASSFNPAHIQIGVLAPSPRFFADSGAYGCLPYATGGNARVSSTGIEIDLCVERAQDWIGRRQDRRVTLCCDVGGDVGTRAGVWLREDERRPGFHVRAAAPIEHVPVYVENRQTQRVKLAKQNRALVRQESQLRGVVRYVEPHDKEQGTPTDLRWIDTYPRGLLQQSEATGALILNLGPESTLLKRGRVHGVAIFALASVPGKIWAIEFMQASAGNSNHGVRLVDLSEAWQGSANPAIEDLITDYAALSKEENTKRQEEQQAKAKQAAPGEPGHNPWAAMALFMQGMHPGHGESGGPGQADEETSMPNFLWKEHVLRGGNEELQWKQRTEVERPTERLSLRAWVDVYQAFGAPVFMVSVGGGYKP